MISVIGIHSNNIGDVTPKVWAYVERSQQATACLDTVENVRALCAAGLKQLWLIVDGNELCGAIVTELVVWPRGKVCLMSACAHDGISVDDESTVLDVIEAWAMSKGCAYLEGCGRRGWARRHASRGYNEVQTLVRKRLGRIH